MHVDIYLREWYEGSVRLMDAERWRKNNPNIRIKFKNSEDVIRWFNLLPREEQQYITQETPEEVKDYGLISMKMTQFGIHDESGIFTDFGNTLLQEVNG